MIARLTLSRLALFAAIALVAAGLSACGVKGPLEAPVADKAAGDSKSAEAGDAGSNTVAKPKPHEGFILDPLLR